MAINISNLSKEFLATKKVLTDITTSFPSGEIAVVIGKNGSGKSTLLNCVAGLLPFEHGTIEVEIKGVKYSLGSDNQPLIPSDSRKKIGYIFQQKALWQHLTVIKNIVHPLTKVHKLSLKEASLIAAEYLELLKLGKEHHNKYPNELSGGQQRKVAIARSLSIQPDLLLIDELEANLDQSALKLTLDIIKTEFIDKGRTVLIVSHSIDLLEQFTPHILLLHDGQIVESAKGIKDLLCREHQRPQTSKIIQESVDSSSSRWFLANQSLEAAIRISGINIREKDIDKLLTEIGKEISSLITRFDPDAQHLLLIATKVKKGPPSSDVRIRCAEKTNAFVLDGSEGPKLTILLSRGVLKEGRAVYEFKSGYREDLQNKKGITLERKSDLQSSRHDSLIDMMFDSNGKNLSYKFTDRHPEISGAYNINIPIPEGRMIEKLSYYEFSTGTRNVYLIGCIVDGEVKGIISIDTYSGKKWSDFIVQQLILVGNMVAIAIKHHEETEVVKPKSSTGSGRKNLYPTS
jgi:ABC-type polar amino acid transport system ATPase subunit